MSLVFLVLGSEVALLSKIDMKKVRIDYLAAISKIRKDIMGKKFGEIKRFRELNEVLEEE